MSSVIRPVFEPRPDPRQSHILVQLLFPEIYTLTKEQEVYLKTSWHYIGVENIVNTFRLAVCNVECSLGRELSNEEHFQFVSGLWRRLNTLLYRCFIEFDNPAEVKRLLYGWVAGVTKIPHP